MEVKLNNNYKKGINMKTKIIAISAFFALSSTAVLAADQTLQANINGFAEPTITENAALHFGQIRLDVGSICTMDNAGAVTGDCDASDANIQIGDISVTGLAPSSAMNITVTGDTGTNLTFVPVATATDGTTTEITVDGVASAFTTDATGTDIALTVYGEMEVDNALTASAAYTVDYIVDVSFQ